MKLPVEFTNKMEVLLEREEYKDFLKSYNMERHHGLRVNTLKISVEDFLKIAPFELDPVPWTEDGFYYRKGENPGKHPYYYAGLYYIQEPSAMLPVRVLDAKPGEKVLDLCAAPGGKTVQIAAGMKGEGILVANDINSNRVKALVKNVELCGVRNVVVTKDSPQALSRNLKGFFDRILVDAPCSGEGMFRKDEDAVKSWQKFKCSDCAVLQRDMLKYADNMLKVGGYMVYSTCTFSPEENEMMISEFLERNENYEAVDIPGITGIERGRPEWADSNKELLKTARLWPHKIKGEGHFVALLRKAGMDEHKENGINAEERSISSDSNLPEIKAFYKFAEDNLNMNLEGHFYASRGNVYRLPEAAPYLD
ncbi:MAG: NOL1/NOP2/sun family putative RNA methylase [Firmicutes bacterium]|nr:NOL1/NOP2/sun family putative RNA methylase [Bacillota bacterium]